MDTNKPTKKATSTKARGNTRTTRAKTAAFHSGVLTSDDIKSLGIISKCGCEDNYEAASYDLRLLNEFIRTKKGGNGTSERAIHGSNGAILTIGRYSSVIVATHEVLDVPNNVVGRFNLRIKIALRGLFVQMGTQVEPGYHGRLFALVHNISDSEIEIELEHENFFTIEFLFLREPVKHANEDRPRYLGFDDIIRPGTKFIEGSLANIVDSVKQEAREANTKAKSAETASTVAKNDVDKALRSGRFYWTVAIAFITALIGSAVAPFMITLAAEKLRPIPAEIREFVDEKLGSIQTLSEEIAKKTNDSISKFQDDVDTLGNEIERLRIELSKLSDQAAEAGKKLDDKGFHAPENAEGQ